MKLPFVLKRRRVEGLDRDELPVAENSPEDRTGPAFSDGIRCAELVRSRFELLVAESLEVEEGGGGGVEGESSGAAEEGGVEVVEEVQDGAEEEEREGEGEGEEEQGGLRVWRGELA